MIDSLCLSEPEEDIAVPQSKTRGETVYLAQGSLQDRGSGVEVWKFWSSDDPSMVCGLLLRPKINTALV